MSCEVVALYFARSAELAGVRSEIISVPQQITSLQLWEEIVKRHPREATNESEDKPKDFIRLNYEKLSTDEVSELVISPCCGAMSLFIGTTRNNFEGKKVIHLEYEAYAPMAEAEMKKICRDVRQKWPSVKHIAVHHRLGLVPVTEASVIVAVSSPHRVESLEAVQYCINTLKATVPIWKKEIYEEEYTWKENKECFWKITPSPQSLKTSPPRYSAM